MEMCERREREGWEWDGWMGMEEEKQGEGGGWFEMLSLLVLNKKG